MVEDQTRGQVSATSDQRRITIAVVCCSCKVSVFSVPKIQNVGVRKIQNVPRRATKTLQLIITYTLEYVDDAGSWQPFSSGMTIGSKRIDVRTAGSVSTTSIRFNVTSGFAVPAGLVLSVYAPGPCSVAQWEYPLA